MPSANIGTIQTSTLSVTENAVIGNDLYANGLGIGSMGVYSQGPVVTADDLTVLGDVTLLGLTNCGVGSIGTDSEGKLTCISDEKLKIIHGPYEKGIDALLQIQPIHFSFKEETGLNGTFYGFSAQNINATIPEAVHKGNNDYLNLDTGALLATTVNAVKDQQQEIISLKSEINILKEFISLNYTN